MTAPDPILLRPVDPKPLWFLTTASRQLRRGDSDRPEGLPVETLLFPTGKWIWATDGHAAYYVRQSALGTHLRGRVYAIERLTRRAVTVHPVDREPPLFLDVLRNARIGGGRLEIPPMADGGAMVSVTIVALARRASALFVPRYWRWLDLTSGPIQIRYNTTDPTVPVWARCDLGEAVIMPFNLDRTRQDILALVGLE